KEFKNLLRTLGAVLGTTLLGVFHSGGIQRAANRVVAHTPQVLYPAAANQNDAVLLQVVAFTTDIGRNFKAVGQAYAPDLTQGRVRLFRRGGIYASTHSTTLRPVLQRGHVAFFSNTLARLLNQLVDCCHLAKLHRCPWDILNKTAGRNAPPILGVRNSIDPIPERQAARRAGRRATWISCR